MSDFARWMSEKANPFEAAQLGSKFQRKHEIHIHEFEFEDSRELFFVELLWYKKYFNICV